jgi:hypothetical protein
LILAVGLGQGVVLVLPASVQDRDGAKKLLLDCGHRQLMSRAARRLRHLFADSGFAGALIDWARTLLKTAIEVMRKPQGQKGFAVIRWAAINTMARCIARYTTRTTPNHHRMKAP